ncbi:Uncharacterised protein [Shigella sonnei]|nr:Uncharacterised protein [Shigella sonnei]
MVIKTNIEAQHLDSMAAFFRATGNPHHPATFKFADLPHRCSHRTCRRSYHQRFALFRLTDIQQPHISGKAWHPQHTQRPRWILRMIAKFHQIITTGYVIVLPSTVAQHPVARLIIRMIRLHNTAHRAADHHAANINRR